MDVLLSGLIPGLIGAFATILAAFISRSYANARIDATPPSKPLGRFTLTLVKTFKKLSILDAFAVTALLDEAVILDSIDLIVCFRGLTYTERVRGRREVIGAEVNLTLPGGQLQTFSALPPGWSIHFEKGGARYQMILVSYESLSCKFDIRKMNSFSFEGPQK